MLDTLIHRGNDGVLYTTVYRKPTHTDQYLDASSHHPLQQKLGVLSTLFRRAGTINSRPQEEQNERRHIREALSKCGYAPWHFRLAERPPPVRPSTEKPKYDNSVVIPYVRDTSEALRRVFSSAGVRTFFKPMNTLRQSLVKPKDRMVDREKSGTVYHISCGDCDAAYIGESNRPLGTRLAEHRRPSCTNSPVVSHILETGHTINWGGVSVLDVESRWFERGVRESIQIYLHGPNLNRDGGRFQLPRIHQQLVRQHSRQRHLSTRPHY